MLSASKSSLFVWIGAIDNRHPHCYTQNSSLIISRHEKTPYHIISDKKPSLKFLHIFCCTCYIVRDGENLDKLKEKEAPCIFVRYATQSKGYRVYNKRTRLIIESIHINFDELMEVMMYDNNTSCLVEENNTDQAADAQFEAYEFINPFTPPGTEAVKSSSMQMHVQTRRQLATDPEMCMFALTMSTADPKNIKEAMADHAWIEAMQEEIHQFDRLNIWELVDKPFGKIMSKKQDCNAMSTTEVEYVALSAQVVPQVLWDEDIA
ncbi:retrovirus-related pol polyprotein from transposon TNT 1-94 [Tanacetum coccineum]